MKALVKFTLIALTLGIFGLAFSAAAADELQPRQAKPAEIGEKAVCPVLHTNFNVTKETPVIDYKGKSYYFCCAGCIEDFQKDPEKFAH